MHDKEYVLGVLDGLEHDLRDARKARKRLDAYIADTEAKIAQFKQAKRQSHRDTTSKEDEHWNKLF